MKRAVVLLSGGPDSAVCLAIALGEGYETYTLAVDYGQRHDKEVRLAEALTERMGVAEHRTTALDLAAFGGSALTDSALEVPDRSRDARPEAEIPITYVPARNTIFLSLALAWAEVLEADAIFIGANAVDYSGYPDCRPEFIEAFERMASLATRRGVEGPPVQIRAPLLKLTKAEIITKGAELGVPFELTWSCYRGGEKACGRCDSCLLRMKGFSEAGLADPVEYES